MKILSINVIKYSKKEAVIKCLKVAGFMYLLFYCGYFFDMD